MRPSPTFACWFIRSVPLETPKGELILVHGLEGSSASGYARSMVHAALERGWVTHRFNMRGCGGTDELAVTGYHAGQTSDLLAFLRERRRASSLPIFVIGFSLGGNVTLKLAGELGESARGAVDRGVRRVDAHRPGGVRRRAGPAARISSIKGGS